MTVRVVLVRPAMSPVAGGSPSTILVADDSTRAVHELWPSLPRKGLEGGHTVLPWVGTPFGDKLIDASLKETDGDLLAALVRAGQSNRMYELLDTRDFDSIKDAADYIYGEVWTDAPAEPASPETADTTGNEADQ